MTGFCMKCYTGLKWVNEDLWPTNINNSIFYIKPLSANPTKWSNTLKRFVGNLSINCFSLFYHFVGLSLKGLRFILQVILVCRILCLTYVILSAICYHLGNFENVKKTHGGVLLSVKLQVEACDFTDRTLLHVFYHVFKIVQMVSNCAECLAFTSPRL